MSLVSDIDAILSRDDLTEAEKRDLIYELKGGAVRDALAGATGQTVNLGAGLQVTFLAPVTWHDDGRLEVWISARRGSNRIAFPEGTLPFYIVNPPILVPDPNGEVDRQGRKYREDPLEAARQILRDILARYQ